MPALTKERVQEFIEGAKDVARKVDALRGMLAQLRQANDALNQQWLQLHTDYPDLVDGITSDARIIGETFSPKQLNQFAKVACEQMENLLTNQPVVQGTHGDAAKRLSKVIV